MVKGAKDIEKKIIEILAFNLDINPEKITPESRLVEDLGMDSFKAVELNFELKDKFGVEIPDEDFKKIKKVKDIFDYILNNIKRR